MRHIENEWLEDLKELLNVNNENDIKGAIRRLKEENKELKEKELSKN